MKLAARLHGGALDGLEIEVEAMAHTLRVADKDENLRVYHATAKQAVFKSGHEHILLKVYVAEGERFWDGSRWVESR